MRRWLVLAAWAVAEATLDHLHAGIAGPRWSMRIWRRVGAPLRRMAYQLDARWGTGALTPWDDD